MTDKRSEFIARAKEELDLLNAKIIDLEARANEKSGELRRELKAKIS